MLSCGEMRKRDFVKRYLAIELDFVKKLLYGQFD